MRSTRAVAAVERLKTRSAEAGYAMVRTASGLFYLSLRTGGAPPRQIGEALPLDAFVTFVNSLAPQAPRRASKLDTAFEDQLARTRAADKSA